MSNPVLNAEQFSNAVYHFADIVNTRLGPMLAGASGDVDRLQQAAGSLADSVARLAKIEGMRAENMQRQHYGQGMMYLEKDFVNA